MSEQSYPILYNTLIEVLKHIDQRFNDLIQILDTNEDIIVIFPSEKSFHPMSEKNISTNNLYPDINVHASEMGIPVSNTISGKLKEWYNILLKKYNKDEKIRLYFGHVGDINMSRDEKIGEPPIPINIKYQPSSNVIHIFYTNEDNWNLDDNQKIDNKIHKFLGEKNYFDIQKPGIFGIAIYIIAVYMDIQDLKNKISVKSKTNHLIYKTTDKNKDCIRYNIN